MRRSRCGRWKPGASSTGGSSRMQGRSDHFQSPAGAHSHSTQTTILMTEIHVNMQPVAWAGCWQCKYGGAVSAQVEAVTKTVHDHSTPSRHRAAAVVDCGGQRCGFEDANGNGYLDANEQATLTYKLNNAPTALGDAQGMVCEVRLEGASSGVTVSEQIQDWRTCPAAPPWSLLSRFSRP